MQAQDWAYLVGSYSITADSVTLVAYRRIRNTVQANIPPNWTTNVTIDSLPGRVVVEFYDMTKGSSAGEVAARYSAILSAVSGKTNLAYWIGVIDANYSNSYNQKRNKGKNLLIDSN